jgi:hypothetical protein
VHASAYLTVLGEGKAWNLQLMSCCDRTVSACAGTDFPEREAYCSLVLCKLVFALLLQEVYYSLFCIP